jgi:hypothetical protein
LCERFLLQCRVEVGVGRPHEQLLGEGDRLSREADPEGFCAFVELRSYGPPAELSPTG